MNDPMLPIEHRSQRLGQFRTVAFWGKKHRPSAAPADLDEKGAVIVPVA